MNQMAVSVSENKKKMKTKTTVQKGACVDVTCIHAKNSISTNWQHCEKKHVVWIITLLSACMPARENKNALPVTRLLGYIVKKRFNF